MKLLYGPAHPLVELPGDLAGRGGERVADNDMHLGASTGQVTLPVRPRGERSDKGDRYAGGVV
jgi:hypothetical protein